MAKDKKKFEEAPIALNNELSARWDSMHQGKKAYMMAHMSEILKEYFGIDLTKENAVKDQAGNLKLFEINDNGERVDALENCSIDSEEFLQKIDKGRIFCLEPGKKDPIQLQIDEKDEIAFSRPVPESMIPKPKALGGWVSFWGIFGFYKEQKNKYSQEMKKYNNYNDAAKKAGETRDPESETMQSEKAAFDEETKQQEAAEAEALKKAEEERLKSDIDSYQSQLDISIGLMQDIYGSKPAFHEDQLNCQYTQEQFDTLKPYEISDIKVGDKALDDKQFMSLGLLKALTPEIGGKIRATNGIDPNLNVVANNTFYTSDLYGWGTQGRANVGTYFKDAQAPARDQAMEALEAYKAGNKEPLAALIGKGLHFTANNLPHRGLDSMANMGLNGAAAEAVTLLDQDPELKKLAMDPKIGGLTQKDINIAKVDRELVKIYRANEWAVKKINQAAAEGKDLDPATKQKAIDARLKYEVLNRPIKAELAQKENSPEFWEKGAEIMKMRKPIDDAFKVVSGNYLAGKISEKEYVAAKKDYIAKGEYQTVLASVMLNKFIGTPDMYGKIGEGLSKGKSVEDMAQSLINNSIPSKDAMKNMKPEDLEAALAADKLFEQKAPEVKEPVVDEPAPEPQKVQEVVKEEVKEAVKEEHDPSRSLSKEDFQERLKMFNGPRA